MNNKIQDYFLVGDLHTAALISKQGSIDWLCCPHFDSPSIFARMLDDNGGSFSLEVGDISVNSDYIENTAIVEHRFEGKAGTFTVKDFMLPQPVKSCSSHFLIRKITGINGSSKVRLRFDPRPGYGRDNIIFEVKESSLSANIDSDILFLHFPEGTDISKSDSGYSMEVTVDKGQEKEVILEYTTDQSEYVHWNDYESKTIDFWHNWLEKGNFIEFCKEMMVRSAIMLKLMQYYPTGAIIASPTTSLPEEIGGIRNWDYRYTWIRDATFALYAFHIMGYREELLKFFDFIENIAEECKECGGTVHLMYTIDGFNVPDEEVLDNFEGFKKSSPVRIGNGASRQFQLDAYGSLIDAYYFMWRRNRLKLSDRTKEVIISLVSHIEEVWMEKDEGIWEVRSGRKHFTYSKVMAWVGIDRAIRMSGSLEISKDIRNEWKMLAGEIKQWIWENCFNEGLGTFTQHPDTTDQDATNLLFVLLQFLDRHDKQTRDIINRTCEELSYKKSFMYRYFSEDNLRGKEGAFILCTFWMIAALAAVEEIDHALDNYYDFRKYIDKTMLMSEEIDPETGEYLGNFPQAFSHMGLILAAFYVNKYKGRLNVDS